MTTATIDMRATLPTSGSSRWLHVALDAFNQRRLSPACAPVTQASADLEERQLHALELRFVEAERERIRDRAAEAPSEPAAFVKWFEALETGGPGQNDPLFPWLEHEATREEMTWFLRQEVAGEAGFDDLVALTQIKMPPGPKLALARNYWDEMGRGHLGGMHGPMLARLADELGIHGSDGREVVWEPLALANLLVALAMNRSYAYHSVGALGVVELTAPGRAARVNAGLRRLGIDGEARRYFALHAALDIKHSKAWNEDVIFPLVAADSRMAQCIAEGALLRLTAGARCFARYRIELGVDR